MVETGPWGRWGKRILSELNGLASILGHPQPAALLCLHQQLAVVSSRHDSHAADCTGGLLPANKLSVMHCLASCRAPRMALIDFRVCVLQTPKPCGSVAWCLPGDDRRLSVSVSYRRNTAIQCTERIPPWLFRLNGRGVLEATKPFALFAAAFACEAGDVRSSLDEARC